MQQFIRWSRANLFATRMNTFLSLISLWLVYVTIDGVVSWAFINASFFGADKASCIASPYGACWPSITAKFNQFIYGNYPEAAQWRVDIVFALGALGLGFLIVEGMGFKKQLAIVMLTVYPVLTFILLS